VKNELVIVSLLDGKGPTGVETHFNQLIHEARAHGIDGLLISAYPSKQLWTKFASVAARVIGSVSKEHAEIFAWWVSTKVIEGKLTRALSRRASQGNTITLCAQDPLSAKIALKVRRNHDCRVVAVIHYNVSVAEELFLKGEAKVDGPVWRFVVRTEQQTLPHVDQLVFVSEFMRGVILERLPAVASVPHAVIPNFASQSRTGDHPLAITGDMISIGTLEPRKNQEFLLHVLAKAKSLGCCYTLTLVGNGPDQARLMALAKALGIENQINFAGFCKNAAALIPQHRILVHAARMENMPISLIEALAAGRPILAPAVGGIREIFSDAVQGYYWPLDDIDASAALLIEVLSNADTYRRFSDAALLRYRTKFDCNTLVSRWLATILNAQGADRSAISVT
jgi:glycosyltransferase involved in cell wall biosynthesis